MMFASLLLRPTVLLSIALALSVGANYLLYNSWQGEVRRSGQLVEQRDEAVAAGKACSAGVDKLRREGETRAKTAAVALAKAREAARVAEARSLTTLGTAPTVPGDLCASAAVLNQAKLKERAAARAVPR
jgi:hypothetical protein